MKRFWLGFAYLNLALAIFGTDLWSRMFVKLRIGPLYILEVFFIFILASAVGSGAWIPSKRLGRILWAPIAFFAWGTILVLFDLIQGYSHLTTYTLTRIAQHAITFVYPLMWIGVGVWAYLVFPQRWIRWLIMGLVLFNALRNFKGEHITNLSLGPLIAIPYSYCLIQAQQENLAGLRRCLYITLTFLFGFLTFYPFWVMYVTSMQRTTLLILLVLIISVPLILAKNRIILRWRSIVLPLAFFVVGIFVAVYLKSEPQSVAQAPSVKNIATVESKTRLKTTPTKSASVGSKNQLPVVQFAMKSLQHGEDMPYAENSRPFQARTRRFIWKTAIHDWLRNPILGIRFIPEVPSYMAPGLLNHGGYASPGDPPVSGPHNSYLSVLARMGVVGMLIFVFFTVHVWNKARQLVRSASLNLENLFLLFVPLNGAIYAFFNVGFESPHNCMIMWVFTGFLMAKENDASIMNNAHFNRP